MGPPRTRAQHLLARRGRFHEGSMNDRASAVPPVHFLGPQERDSLEGPVYADYPTTATDTLDPAYFGRHEEVRQHRPRPQPQPQPRQLATRKPAAKTNIFGQVWEGVRGKLRLRRDADDKDKGREERRKELQVKAAGQDETPSRDEVFANYQQLVASGFFSSHAIQSTRYGLPPNCRPSTAHGARDSNHPPQWPLAPTPLTPKSQDHNAQNVYSPVSATSSRGTKRAAAESPTANLDEGDGRGEGEGEDEEPDDGEDESTLAHRFLPKRLRKSASRDISIPKLRSVASRKNLRAAVAASRRSISMGAKYGDGKPEHGKPEREPNKLLKRVPWAQQQQSEGLPMSRASLDVASKGRTSTESYGSVTRRIRRPTSARNLRCAARETVTDGGLKVVPDVNRGIPRVPDIPVKFTYGEDRENGEPWRGLRR